MEEQNLEQNSQENNKVGKPLISKMRMMVSGLVMVGLLTGLVLGLQLSSKKELSENRSQAATMTHIGGSVAFSVMGKQFNFQNMQTCGYGTKPNVVYDANINISGYKLNNCDTASNSSFWSTSFVTPGVKTFTVQNIPAGYECGTWNHHIYDVNTKSYKVLATGEGCSVTRNFDVVPTVGTSDNANHLWFYLKKKTSIGGSVAYVQPDGKVNNFQNIKTCGYGTKPNVIYDANVNVSNYKIDQCNTATNESYWSTGVVSPGQKTFKVQNIPAGYECDTWNHHIYDAANKTWKVLATGSGCSVTRDFQAVLGDGANDNQNHLWFYLKKSNTVTPTVVPTRTIITEAPFIPTTDDVVLIIDRSSSMLDDNKDNETNRLNNAKKAAKTFVDTIATSTAGKQKTIRIAVVSFGSKGTTNLALSTDYALVKSKIDSIVNEGKGTCVACGLQLANKVLSSTPSNTKKYQVLLSDGRANTMINGTKNSDGTTGAPKEMLDQAAAGKKAGSLIYVMAYGSDAIQSRLKTVASDPDSTYYKYQSLVIDLVSHYKNAALTVARP